jgi:hypothetical protein
MYSIYRSNGDLTFEDLPMVNMEVIAKVFFQLALFRPLGIASMPY